MLKKIFRRIVSVVLIMTLLVSAENVAFASDNYLLEKTINISDEIVYDEEVYAKEVYVNLSPEAKAIFDKALEKDAELLEFHKTYVDPESALSYVDDDSFENRMICKAAAADPMTVLSAQLAALSLPSAVLYSLKAMGAAMVAAIADGPLPVGDILLAAATASAVVVIAANWNAVSGKWDSIVAAFKKAFSASASNIVSAFKTILSKIKSRLQTNPCVTIDGQIVTVNGVKYTCKTRATSLTSSQKSNNKYFPALLYGGTVYVDSAHPLSTSVAQTIMYANSKSVGVWATAQSYARGLCGGAGKAIWHNQHVSSEGYYYHYHHPSYKNFHCWYL